MSNYRL